MSFTQITSTNLSTDLATQIAAGTSANAAVANIVSLTVKTCQVTDSSYNALDDTAANTTGGYLVLTGTGFTPNCIVIIGQTNATSTSYVNTSCITAQTQAFSASTYNVYVVDSYTGATAIKVNGYTTSSFPAWGTAATLSNQQANTAFGVSLSANSDSSITYANTTALPAGTALLANGYFYGTVSIGTQTTYSFTVDAKDAENQDALRTFSLTVTVTPPYKLYMWGKNNWGNLGLSDVTTYRSSPTQVGALTNWNKTSVGENHNLAIKYDGTLWAWGYNGDGRLGDNSTTSRSSPVQIGTSADWSSVSAGNFSSAIKTDGTLWTWGGSTQGRGLNDTIAKSSPTQVGALTNWSKVVCARDTRFAIKTDGTLWFNGNKTYLNDQPTNTSSPVQVGSGTTWLNVYCTGYVAYAIKTNGTLWSWGNGYYGVLGDGSSNRTSSPAQVGSATNWALVATSGVVSYNTVAIKTDGTMWAWGRDYKGGLGRNTDGVSSNLPLQVGSGTYWANAFWNWDGIIATRTDGTLWSWGFNDKGQLGQNDLISRSSPTQIGTRTDWSIYSNGFAQSTMAAITTS